MENWSRWYKKDYPAGVEKCFVELKPSIPSYVDSVIDFGCAAGRNLELFDGAYKLYGVDLVAEDEVEWRRPFVDLTYIASRLQDFPRRFVDSMERFLCISHGTLMYLDPLAQQRFVSYLIDRGCKNFVFQEYDRKTLHAQHYWEPSLLNRLRRRQLGYPFSIPSGFEKRWYRLETPTWVRVDQEARTH